MSFSRQSLESSPHSAIPAEAVPPLAGSLDTEVRIRRSSVFLSEAFLDSSAARVRAEIPKEYQTKFDELRGGILAFCKEFGIPSEALSNIKTFGSALSAQSPHISLSRMNDASLLFRSLEHLIAYHELWKNPEELQDALLEAEQLYDLSRQYHAQVELLQNAGILIEDGHSAFTGIDGQKYFVPPMESIAQRLYERRETLRTKQEQKFTRLLLVPFGMSLDVLISIFRKFLRDYQKEHPDFYLDISDPLHVWEGLEEADSGEEPRMVYSPNSFDPKNHQGKTKYQMLIEQEQDATFAPGWRVLLLQAPHDNTPGFRRIPKKGEGVTEEEGIPRFDLEAEQYPSDYLSLFLYAKNDPTSSYHGESGMTLEDWMSAFMVHLEETGQPLDSCFNGSSSDMKEGIPDFVGSFLPLSAQIPFAYWNDHWKQADFNRSAPHIRDNVHGTRSVVVV